MKIYSYEQIWRTHYLSITLHRAKHLNDSYDQHHIAQCYTRTLTKNATVTKFNSFLYFDTYTRIRNIYNSITEMFYIHIRWSMLYRFVKRISRCPSGYVLSLTIINLLCFFIKTNTCPAMKLYESKAICPLKQWKSYNRRHSPVVCCYWRECLETNVSKPLIHYTRWVDLFICNHSPSSRTMLAGSEANVQAYAFCWATMSRETVQP